ncbi:MAG: c-type cytochrome [Mucilaginibacter sp.]|nr:c-type cytochrome [Mucilaginibacter sp.]
MYFNRKLTVAIALISGAVLLASMTAIQQQPQQQERKLVNIKVFPKSITYRQLDHVMDGWAKALGVKCTFCHARNDETKKMDFASDAKPEKLMARQMFLMAAKINKKYFKAKKDSLGMIMESSVNCNTCHHGVSHPEVSLASNGPQKGPVGPGQGGPGVAQPAPDKKP